MPRPVVSPGAERRYTSLAAYQQGDEENGWWLLHLCQALAVMHDLLDRALRHDDTGSGQRRIHSPTRAPAEYLHRLRAIAGVWDTGQPDDVLREEIIERPRLRRCSEPALMSEVMPTLDPATTPEMVRLLEHYAGDAFRMMLLTPPSKTPDPAATLQAAKRHEPLYVYLEHLTPDDVTWGDLVGTWDDQVGSWAEQTNPDFA